MVCTMQLAATKPIIMCSVCCVSCMKHDDGNNAQLRKQKDDGTAHNQCVLNCRLARARAHVCVCVHYEKLSWRLRTALRQYPRTVSPSVSQSVRQSIINFFCAFLRVVFVFLQFCFNAFD